MQEPAVVPAKASPGGAGGLAHRVFSHRLAIGLIFVGIGSLLARPGTLWGDLKLPGVVFSALLVCIGMGLRYWAAGSAGTHTHSAQIEGPRLATGGPYQFVRNPIYLGSMILGLGMVGLIGDIRLLPLYIAAFVFLYAVLIPAEERFLRKKFGSEYEEYCRLVPRLIPRFTRHSSKDVPFHWSAFRGELHILGVLLAIYGAIHLGAWAREQLS